MSKTMRAIVASALAACAVGLAACGGGDEPSASTGSPSATDRPLPDGTSADSGSPSATPKSKTPKPDSGDEQSPGDLPGGKQGGGTKPGPDDGPGPKDDNAQGAKDDDDGPPGPKDNPRKIVIGVAKASSPTKPRYSWGGPDAQLRKISSTTPSLQAKAGRVTIVFRNDTGQEHSLHFEGGNVSTTTKTLKNGKAQFSAKLKPGAYNFYCTVSGHQTMGMEGHLDAS